MRRTPAAGLLLAALATAANAQMPTLTPLELFVRPDKGHCIACHQLPEGAGPATRADLGPRLEAGRMRALGPSRLRELIDDPTRANPETVMPPFGRHRILELAEIDRLVQFLHALP